MSRITNWHRRGVLWLRITTEGFRVPSYRCWHALITAPSGPWRRCAKRPNRTSHNEHILFCSLTGIHLTCINVEHSKTAKTVHFTVIPRSRICLLRQHVEPCELEIARWVLSTVAAIGKCYGGECGNHVACISNIFSQLILPLRAIFFVRAQIAMYFLIPNIESITEYEVGRWSGANTYNTWYPLSSSITFLKCHTIHKQNELQKQKRMETIHQKYVELLMAVLTNYSWGALHKSF